MNMRIYLYFAIGKSHERRKGWNKEVEIPFIRISDSGLGPILEAHLLRRSRDRAFHSLVYPSLPKFRYPPFSQFLSSIPAQKKRKGENVVKKRDRQGRGGEKRRSKILLKGLFVFVSIRLSFKDQKGALRGSGTKPKWQKWHKPLTLHERGRDTGNGSMDG